MKHWIPPVAVLAALLAFCLWDGQQMKQDTLRWQEQLAQADALAVNEDWSRALQQLEESHQDWQSRFLYIHTVSRRDTVDSVEGMYQRAMAFAKTEELSEFRAELSDLQNQMRVLAEMEAPSILSIF